MRPESLALASSLNNLAYDYLEMGRFDDAEPLYRRALAMHEKLLGPNHPKVGLSLNNLAEISWHQNDLEEAESLYRRALAIKLKTIGLLHPSTEKTVNNLAQIYREQGRYQEAYHLFEDSVAIAEKTLGPDHPDVARALNNWSSIYFDLGDYETATRLLLEAIAIRERNGQIKHPSLANTFFNLAGAHEEAGLEVESKSLVEVGRALWRDKDLGPEDASLIADLEPLVEVYLGSGSDQEAAWLLEFVIAFKEEIYGIESQEVADSLEDYASVLKILGQFDEALVVEDRAAVMRENLAQD
jgi:tetratricopeptide (TPR) repeat protein